MGWWDARVACCCLPARSLPTSERVKLLAPARSPVRLDIFAPYRSLLEQVTLAIPHRDAFPASPTGSRSHGDADFVFLIYDMLI